MTAPMLRLVTLFALAPTFLLALPPCAEASLFTVSKLPAVVPSHATSHREFEVDQPETEQRQGAGQGLGRGGLRRQALGGQPNLCPVGELSYQGGPLMLGPVTVHLIYYGDWSTGVCTHTIETLIRSISNGTLLKARDYTTPMWWHTVMQYQCPKGWYLCPRGGANVSSIVRLGKVVYDRYSRGSNLTDDVSESIGNNDIFRVVKRLVLYKRLPADTNAVYFVLTSRDVRVGSGPHAFCAASGQGYCGKHLIGDWTLGRRLVYAHAGDPMTQCRPQSNCRYGARPDVVSNGCPAADAMASIILHEIAESVTDPAGIMNQLAWYGSLGENGDICATQYFRARLFNGKRYNLYVGASWHFMVQSMFNPNTQSCNCGNRCFSSIGSC